MNGVFQITTTRRHEDGAPMRCLFECDHETIEQFTAALNAGALVMGAVLVTRFRRDGTEKYQAVVSRRPLAMARANVAAVEIPQFPLIEEAEAP